MLSCVVSCIGGACGRQLVAEVYRGARVLWPSLAKDQERTVTVRIGQLASADISTIITAPESPGRDVWLLLQQNENEGEVQLRSVRDINKLNRESAAYVVLDFEIREESDILASPAAALEVVEKLQKEEAARRASVQKALPPFSNKGTCEAETRSDLLIRM